MTDRLLLRRSGNGYLFAHHLLRDHLTSPQPASGNPGRHLNPGFRYEGSRLTCDYDTTVASHSRARSGWKPTPRTCGSRVRS
jgi:hypothetical protein